MPVLIRPQIVSNGADDADVHPNLSYVSPIPANFLAMPLGLRSHVVPPQDRQESNIVEVEFVRRLTRSQREMHLPIGRWMMAGADE